MPYAKAFGNYIRYIMLHTTSPILHFPSIAPIILLSVRLAFAMGRASPHFVPCCMLGHLQYSLLASRAPAARMQTLS